MDHHSVFFKLKEFEQSGLQMLAQVDALLVETSQCIKEIDSLDKNEGDERLYHDYDVDF